MDISWLNLIYAFAAFLGICGLIGGFLSFRNGRQTQLTKFQEATNTALKQRIEALEGKINDFEKENAIQRHIISTITSALKQRGMIVTIDGDMVSIENVRTGSSTHRKRTITTTQAVVKKEED
jgi:hypothetical protein